SSPMVLPAPLSTRAIHDTVMALRAICVMLLMIATAAGLRAQEPVPGDIPSGTGAGSGSGSAFVIARLKYSGGGDWYNDPTSDINMLEYLRKQTGMNVRPTFEYV